MKSLVAVVLALSVSNAWGRSEVQAVEPGVYNEPTNIFLAWVQDYKTCRNENGQWDKENETCVVSAENTVTVSQDPKDQGVYWVNVETVGTNIHLCDYAAPAVQQQDGSWLATAEATEYVLDASGHLQYDPKTGEAITRPAQCQVSVESVKAGTSKSPAEVRVVSSGVCEEFCGINARLDIDRAIKAP